MNEYVILQLTRMISCLESIKKSLFHLIDSKEESGNAALKTLMSQRFDSMIATIKSIKKDFILLLESGQGDMESILRRKDGMLKEMRNEGFNIPEVLGSDNLINQALSSEDD